MIQIDQIIHIVLDHLIIQQFLRQKIFRILQNILIWSGKKSSDKSFTSIRFFSLYFIEEYYEKKINSIFLINNKSFAL